MGVLPPTISWLRVREEDRFKKHPILYKSRLHICDLSYLIERERYDIDATEMVFGLTRAERLEMWQAEYDKRTLLRPAAAAAFSSEHLLRAANGRRA